MKRILMSAVVILTSLVTSAAMAGAPEVESLKDVAVAQLNDDGSYSVVCTNGNRETVSAADVRIGNVCPNDKNSTPTEILSLQRREDGQYDVVCRDLTKTVASEQDILLGQVCNKKSPPKVVIEDGMYSSPGLSDCDLKASYANNALVAVHARFTTTGAVGDLACTGNICVGSFAGYPQKYQFKILNEKSFEYSTSDNTNARVFTKASGF